MSVGLLDVNVLVALAWPSHVHHHSAHIWFKHHHQAGWATCPLTQCGFVRVSSNPQIIREAVAPRDALALLHEITAAANHHFWPDDLPMTEDAVPTALLMGHRQVSDAYLLGLAIRHNGRLVTFDRSVESLLPPNSAQLQSLEIVPVDLV